MKFKTITGRPPAVREIKEAKRLRKVNKLSYRDIAKVMSADLKTVYRWVNYPLAK